ncbi:hypothetical protein JRQ81_014430 [Phrynocephalus forsythii]|uniref:Nucleoside phosphorylase domain-containing protein n=1 Tax=Phrynocephalus forsythii TaxID=171643 RepID=A0A9Q1B3I3_9SAUR|nr:hypothetical protein JRQ81_014430 [Phrynocephalus forsythii]
MIIRDHINLLGLTGQNPLLGPNEERLGPRFPALVDAYDREIRTLAMQIATHLGYASFVKEGVYCMVGGPNFESVAEARLLHLLGADAVVSGFDLKATSSVRLKPGWTQNVSMEMKMAKSLENIKILQRISRSKTFSLEELKRHSSVLLEKNKELVQKIEEMDANTAKQARDLLQQYDLFGTIIATLQDSNQNQAGVAKAEYLATEKTVEKNMAKLELEAKRTQSKVHALQEELNVLRTYMDKEYPVKAVQIGFLMRSIRNQKEEQQDELEDMEDLCKRFLESLAEKAREEQEGILQAVAEEKLMQYQDGLKQINRNNLELKRQIEMQKEVIDELMKEISELHKSLIKLHHSVGDPRDVIFA